MNTAESSLKVSARQFSGRHWTRQYEGSTSLSSLRPPFRNKVDAFVSALRKAGAVVNVSAAYRTQERAYLMHWSWRLVKQGFDASKVPAMPGVDIVWAHTGADGAYSRQASVTAAAAMVEAFAIGRLGVAPVLESRHTHGCAIDIRIHRHGELSIADAKGNIVKINSSPRSGLNPELHAVGASYGVIKFNKRGRDDPHWSDTGA